jgi:hypothetical protein
MKRRKMVARNLYEPIEKLVRKTDHKTLAIWAADCAERVLPYFEEKRAVTGTPAHDIRRE